MPQDADIFVWLILLGFIGACLLTWMKLAAKICRGEAVLPMEPRSLVPWTGIDLALVLMGMVLFGSLAQLILREYFGLAAAVRLDELEPAMLNRVQWLSMGATVLAVLFAVVLVVARVGATSRDLGVGLQHWRDDLQTGAIGFIAIAPPVYALQAALFTFFPQQHPLIDTLQQASDRQIFVAIAVAVSVVAPISEEFLFRVLFQGWLEAKFAPHFDSSSAAHNDSLGAFNAPAISDATLESSNPPAFSDDSFNRRGLTEDLHHSSTNPYAAPRGTSLPAASLQARVQHSLVPSPAHGLAIVVSSLLFALLHVGQGPAPIPLFFLSLVLGYLYQRTHRIWPSLIVHFLLNSTTLMMLWFNLGE